VIAVVPVRGGRLPVGADAAVAECGGRVLLVGEGTHDAAHSLRSEVTDVLACEVGAYAPGAWAEGLVALLAHEPCVVLPGSPDGRDLLGRLASALGRPSIAWCTEVTEHRAVTTRHDGAASVTVPIAGDVVVTLVPRASFPPGDASLPPIVDVTLVEGDVDDAVVDRVEDADPAEVDLVEADRIVAGGLGLGGPDEFAVLADVAARLGASLGATRPVADRGVVGHERQIGTTGVVVDPSLYVAFGISGAVQHTAGLGSPGRVVAVNLDPACPMMAMADLAVIADAPSTARALVRRLAAEGSDGR